MAGTESSGRRRRVMVVETGIVYPSISACAKAIRGRKSSISQCLNGTQKTHCRMHFIDPDEGQEHWHDKLV